MRPWPSRWRPSFRVTASVPEFGLAADTRIDEMMPIVYTPVVGEACQKFSHIYRRGRGLYVPYDQKHNIEKILRNYHTTDPSVIVVTDRRLLDDQIQTTIKQFMQVGATVGHAEYSGELRKFIEEGKKIIVSTVQKFPFILDEIATEGGKTFAIVIDEAQNCTYGQLKMLLTRLGWRGVRVIAIDDEWTAKRCREASKVKAG